MITRLRAWLDRSGPTPAAPVDDPAARIAELEKQLSTEQMHSAGLTSEVRELTGRIAKALIRLDNAEGLVARLRADRTYVTAERCECGGDAELHWRTRAHAAEAQAARDRTNAVRLTDELERVVHIAEQPQRGVSA